MSLNCNDETLWSVKSSLEISYSYHFVEEVFSPTNARLAKLYAPWKRCLALVDSSVYHLHGDKLRAYFEHHGIASTLHPVCITEDRKDIDSLLELCHHMTNFDLIRREPVLVVGGGLLTDVAGFACAVYRRATRYIRIPTSLIGLIDASVSNRVAVNWNGLKNRLGCYHEPLHTIIDTNFLRTLPQAEIRNGIAEILKISSCTDLATFKLLEQHSEALIHTRFGQTLAAETELRGVANTVIRKAIKSVLVVEVPNSREQNLDRVMFFGHTWSPVLELAVDPPLMHGHAISVDMCYSASLAFSLGLLSETQYDRFLAIFSRLGLALDHPAFSCELMLKATSSTVATRDGKLRAPVPVGGLGCHEILGQVEEMVLIEAWDLHKKVASRYARGGAGIDVTVAGRMPN